MHRHEHLTIHPWELKLLQEDCASVDRRGAVYFTSPALLGGAICMHGMVVR